MVEKHETGLDQPKKTLEGNKKGRSTEHSLILQLKPDVGTEIVIPGQNTSRVKEGDKMKTLKVSRASVEEMGTKVEQ